MLLIAVILSHTNLVLLESDVCCEDLSLIEAIDTTEQSIHLRHLSLCPCKKHRLQFWASVQ